jgi:hypothetical protein
MQNLCFGRECTISGNEVAKIVSQQIHRFYSIAPKMMFGSVLEHFRIFRNVNMHNLCFERECTMSGNRSCENDFTQNASILLH